jgi:aminocarboxymuconate-semialdehyde decarboxylase
MTRQWPTRFAGLATLPVQDVKAAIDELERAVTVLGLKGAELDTIVNGENWDEPRFLPLFKAAEAMGAVLFFHPQPQHNFMTERAGRYGLFNSLGVIVEDAIVVAILILGGVLEACPGLKACIAHGGGPACYAMGRLDRGWHGTPAARARTPQPPSSYQRRLYYDTVVGSEAALRFLLDQVGADRVVLGSDWPFVPWHPSPVAWLESLASVTTEEKEQILWRNLEALLRL